MAKVVHKHCIAGQTVPQSRAGLAGLQSQHQGAPKGPYVDRQTCSEPTYTFIVLALLILSLHRWSSCARPPNIFPDIDIPVVSIGWTYTGLNPEELEGRLTSPYEKALTTLVDNIQHIESTTYNGEAIVKVFLSQLSIRSTRARSARWRLMLSLFSAFGDERVGG